MNRENIILAAVGILGLPAEDKITGVSGVITSVSFDISGCVTAILTPKADEKGEVKTSAWLDVQRLEIAPLGAARVMGVPEFTATGGALDSYGQGAMDKPGR